LQAQMLAFAKCMRSHGVPAFPDPQVENGGTTHLQVTAGQIDPNSPVVKAAMVACRSKFASKGAAIEVRKFVHGLQEGGVAKVRDAAPSRRRAAAIAGPIRPGLRSPYQGWRRQPQCSPRGAAAARPGRGWRGSRRPRPARAGSSSSRLPTGNGSRSPAVTARALSLSGGLLSR
jgi:hypothetical protein